MRFLAFIALSLIAALAWVLTRPPGRVVDDTPITVQRAPSVSRSMRERPAPLPGARLELTLIEPPAERYAAPSLTEADRALAPLVEQAGALYDPALGHAARELAAFYAAEGALAPSALLAFLLDSAGAAAWGVRQAVVITNARGPAAVVDAVESHLEGGAWIAGAGEAIRLGEGPTRVIAVLLARPTVNLKAVDRQLGDGDTVRLRGRLATGYSKPELVIMDPGLGFSDLEVDDRGGGFRVEFPVDMPGMWTAELLATGPHGPTPLAQLVFHVDEDLPDHFEGVWPPEDGPRVAPAERVASLLARDRTRFGLPGFQRDAELDRIAAAHCRDMKRQDYVGHVSPTTGGPADRLRSAGYPSATSGENVAYNKSLWDAQAGLLRSLGHRRNILSDTFTHIGVCALQDGEHWYVTQLFVTPRPVIDDPDAARTELVDRLAQARRAAGAPVLRRKRVLERIAQAEAERNAPSPQQALDRVGKAGVTGKVSAWVGRMGLVSQFEPSKGLLESEFRRVGVGVAQAESGEIRIVVLLSR